MKFMLNPASGDTELSVRGEEYKYLIKVRRHGIGDIVVFRRLDHLERGYRYRLERTDGRNAYFILEGHHDEKVGAEHPLHIGWCIVDPKTIEKTLPMLVELGVEKITFIHCKRSQKNYRIDYDRLERIMESSIMQCGRTSLIKLSESPSLSAFFEVCPDAAVFDFGGRRLGEGEKPKTVVIGCEGGFDESERKIFARMQIIQLHSPMILRSETAVVAAASAMVW